MDSVEHQGVVDYIKGKSMRVRIEQSSACRDCSSQKLCSSADKQDKLIDIPSFFGSFHVGQFVVVIGKPSSGLKPVALAYVIPLILMMLGLSVSSLWLFPGNDGIAAIIALSVLILYFFLLYPFRKLIQRHFVFTVRPYGQNTDNAI